MNEFKEKVQALIDKYTPALSAKGLKILFAKRYFESDVDEQMSGVGYGSLLNPIENAHNRKKEKRKYYFQRNRYHAIVLTVVPSDNATLPRENCRDYAFVLRKVERAHIGLEPRRIAYEEEKILSKIEKRILKILKKAETASPERICKDRVFDGIRYATRPKYGYKKRVLGKSILAWNLILDIAAVVLALAILLICWLIRR